MDYLDFFDKRKEQLANEICPSLIQRCDKYKSVHPNASFSLRETDHRDCEVVFGSNIAREDEDKLLSLCAKCGSNRYVEYRVFDDYFLPFCLCCQAERAGRGWGQVKMFLLFLDKIDEDYFNNNPDDHLLIGDRKKGGNPNSSASFKMTQALKFRIRVLTNENNLLYLTLQKIRMDGEGGLYIVHDNDKTDKVKFAGVYLNVRDRLGKRVFQGDIVKSNYRSYNGSFQPFIGVATLRHRHPISAPYPFMIETNTVGDFPPSPDSIDYDSAEVIGNLFESPELMIGKNSYETAEGFIRFILETEK